MRYHGKGNPLAVLISCLTLGFLPTILLILGVIWIVQAIVSFMETIPVYIWTLMGVVAAIAFISKMFKEREDDNEK